ncbi:patatin-like phospholipase family protein [Pseudonocardia kujensis]|nr:patatin-like phospholipase family protein [Pseudonocardia kujensis]
MTGIAWEVGVLAGLVDQEVDLGNATTVIGTSAGSFVGSAVASGYDLQRLYAVQLEPDENKVDAKASEATISAWWQALAEGGADPRKVGAAMGRIAKANPEPVPLATRRAVVRSRLVTTDWSSALHVTAIDAAPASCTCSTDTRGTPRRCRLRQRRGPRALAALTVPGPLLD